jgi:cobaltochelatase CobN
MHHAAQRGCAGPAVTARCASSSTIRCTASHQYIATYMYMGQGFWSRCLNHVGTHGNLEWMPGKGAGLSDSAGRTSPWALCQTFYIYNADNPAEGVVAKGAA